MMECGHDTLSAGRVVDLHLRRMVLKYNARVRADGKMNDMAGL